MKLVLHYTVYMLKQGDKIMRIFSYIFIIIIVFIGISFATLNANSVAFNYYLGTKQMPLSLLLVLFFGCGMFFGFLCALPYWFRLRRDKRKLKSRLKLIEKEIDNLRSLPIKGD